MFRHFRLLPLAAVALLLSTESARAGWIVIKNETKSAVVIQEVTEKPGKKGKQVRLLPGEVYREFHLLAGEKRFEVYDPKSPAKPLCRETLSWKAADITFRVELVEKVVKLSPAKQATSPVMLAGAELPVFAGGPATLRVHQRRYARTFLDWLGSRRGWS